MPFLSRRATVLVCAAFAAACLMFAAEWETATSMPGVNLDGLSPKQKTTVLKLLRGQGCSCGCGMKLAQCRFEDPACAYSTNLSAIIVQGIKDGKTEEQAVETAMKSRWGSAHETQILDEPVKLSVAGAPVLGPADAPVTIVEFSDFQCPYCIAAVPELEALLKVYPKQVKLIFRQFPLEIHSDAYRAATAAIAAHKQGKFWVMHDALFEHHQDLSAEAIRDISQRLKLDTTRLQKDMESKETRDTISKDLQEGTDAGVEGTPTIFINGQKYNGRIQLSFLRPLIQDQLKKAGKGAETASR